MKKGLIICIIILTLLTYCNLILFCGAKETVLKLEAEYAAVNQQYNELIQLKYMLISSNNIFQYIRIKNPSLSNRGISDIVLYSFQLGDITGADPYGILTIMDIESDFHLDAIGQSHGELGPMQLLPSNWDKYYQQYGFRYEDKNDWRCTARIAADRFGWLIRKHRGNVIAAIGEYNAGRDWATNEKAQRHIKRFKAAYGKIIGYKERENGGI